MCGNDVVSSYDEVEKYLETTVVKVFGEDITFYRDPKTGAIFVKNSEKYQLVNDIPMKKEFYCDKIIVGNTKKRYL